MKRVVICLMVMFSVIVLAKPALAVSPSTYTFLLGGRMLTDIGWKQQSKELTTNGSSAVGTWFLNMPGHSWIRARFYSVDKTTGGRIELGLKALEPAATVSLRYAYGYWRVGKYRLLAGLTDNHFGALAYSPRQYLGLNEGHLLLFGWGYLWPHRTPQVQFTYEDTNLNFQIALEEPRNKTNWFATGTDTTFKFPRASMTFTFKNKSIMVGPGVSFVQHSYEGGGTSFDDSYNTWAIVLPLKYTIGAFTLKFQGHYGINFAGEYNQYPATWTKPYRQNITSGSVEDTTVYGGYLAGEYNIGKLSIYGGFGYENFSNDAWSGKNGYSKDENVRWAAFIALPYQFTKNFGIQPELAYYSYGDSPATGDSLGNEWLLGAQFRFVF